MGGLCGQNTRRQQRDECPTQYEPVNHKREKTAFRDVPHEDSDHEEPDDERNNRSDRRLDARKHLGRARRSSRSARVSDRFEQFVESTPQDSGYCEKKGVACGGAAPKAHKEPGGDRASRARYAGNQGECLSESEDGRARNSQAVETPAFLADRVGNTQKHAENDQRDCYDPQVPERRLNGVLKDDAEDDDRQAAENDEPAHARIGIRAGHSTKKRRKPLADYSDDVPPEIDEHRRLGSQLGYCGEGRPGVGARAEKRADDPQVGTAGNGKEFGQALDESEDDGIENSHGSLSSIAGTVYRQPAGSGGRNSIAHEKVGENLPAKD